MGTAEDRRRAPRYPIDFPLTIEVHGEVRQARGVNISQGGLMVSTASALEMGAQVTLRFDLANAGEMRLQGVVRHARDEGTGVEFIELSDEDRQTLHAYLRQAAAEALARL